MPRKTKQRAPKVGAQTEFSHGKQWLCHRPTCSCCIASPPYGALLPYSCCHIHTCFPQWRLSLAQKPGVFTGATETSRDNTVGTDAKDATAMSTSVSGGALPPGTLGFLCISSFHLCCNHRERTPPPFHTSSHRGCYSPAAHRPLLSSQNNSLAPSPLQREGRRGRSRD